MLPDLSRIRTMSVGLLLISGEADSASVTLKEPEQSIWLVLIVLLELFKPIITSPLVFWGVSPDLLYVPACLAVLLSQG